MKIEILCSNSTHPVRPYLLEWKRNRESQHLVRIVERKSDLKSGDILFLISCQEIIGQDTRKQYGAVLVIHASDLPKGRGWSPHIWQIIEGKNEIPITLLEAEDEVDSGAVWGKTMIRLEGHELAEEINDLLFRAELELMDFAVDNFGTITPRIQDNSEPTYYGRRKPADSKIDPNRTIVEQFDQLRVADKIRYPAYFELRGHRYYIYLTKEPLYANQ